MGRAWMPLYVADYLADTMHLNASQSGAYLHLIMHYWQHGSLPDDDEKLSRIARMRIEDWRRHRGTVEAFFQPGWRHARIDSELSRSAEISNKRKAAAKQKHSNSSANAPANAEQMHTHTRASSQSPSDPNGSASDAEKELFKRGKEILGANAGGLIAKLLKAKKRNVALCRAAIETASTKQNPREYVGALIAGGEPGEDGRRITNDEKFYGTNGIPGVI